MAWKQSLYTFLLRRFLGPLLTDESKNELYNCIELSFQEGRFLLQNIFLEPSFLTNLFNDKGSDILVEKAFLRKLSINLSIRSSENYDDSVNSSTDKNYGVGTVSTMRKILQLRNKSGTMSLFASIEIEGVEIHFSPLESKHNTNDKVNTTPQTKHNLDDSDNKTGTNGYFASIMDSVMASLRLGVTITDAHFRFIERRCSSSPRSWIGISLSSISYRDMIHPSTLHNQNDMMEFKMGEVLRKVIEISGFSIQTSSHDFATSKSTILNTDGVSTIQIRAFVDNNHEVDDVKDQALDDKNTNVYHDINVSLKERITVSLDLNRIQILQTIFESFEESFKETQQSKIDAQGEEADTILSSNESFNFGHCDTHTKYAADGIMQQYAEARHSARTREVRGGMLLPTSFGEQKDEGLYDDDSSSQEVFDIFFDCNETSFSQYLSFMQSKPVDNETNDPSIVESFRTKISLNLLEGGLRIYFADCDETLHDESAYVNSLHYEEYILILFGGLNVNASFSESKTAFSLDLSHFEIEDAAFNCCKTGKKYINHIDIGHILQFPEDNNLDGRLIVEGPPCISFSFQKVSNLSGSESENDRGNHESFTNISIEISLQPLELSYHAKTLQNIDNIINSLNCNKTSNFDASPKIESPQKGRAEKDRDSIKIICTCPELNLLIPVNQSKISSDDFQVLFARAGHQMQKEIYQPTIGIIFVNLMLEHNKCDKSVLTSENCTIYLSAPSIEMNDKSSTVMEILSFSSDPMISAESAIKLDYSSNCRTFRSVDDKIQSSFPLVPPLSSVKARQETSSNQTIRGENPQGSMLNYAESCHANMNIYVPFLIFDLSLMERKMLSEIVGSIEVFRPSNNEFNDSDTKKKSSKKDCLTGIGFSCDQASISLHNDNCTNGSNRYTCFLVADNLNAHLVVGDSGLQNLRVLSQNVTAYEAFSPMQVNVESADHSTRCHTVKHGKKLRSRGLIGLKNAVPIFYRSNLAYPLSPETPAILLDVIKNKDDGYSDDITIHFSVYDMTYRYALDSEWFQRFLNIFQNLSDTEESCKDDASIASSQINENGSMMKLFVTFSDCVIDYSSPVHTHTTPSRTMIRFGEVRLSCNLISGASVQAYKAYIADVSINVCNWRFPYNTENSRLSCSRQIMSYEDVDTSHVPVNLNRIRHASVEEVLDQMTFISIINFDSIDAVIRMNTVVCQEGGLNKSAQPDIILHLTMGQLSLYACKDSFNTLTRTFDEWLLKFTALSEEEIAALKANTNPTIQVNMEDLRTDAVSKKDMDPQISLLDVIEDDMFVEEPTSSSEMNLSVNRDSNQKEESFSYANIPDSELSATELRKKHRIAETDQTISKITESLLIKNFYTINSTNIHNETCSENSKADNEEKFASKCVELEGDSFKLGDEEWTTVDHAWSRYSPSKGSDQQAVWFAEDNENHQQSKERIPEINIFPQHIPTTQFKDDPILEKSMNAAKFAGTNHNPHVRIRLLVKDFNVNCRFFDGFDWVNDPKLSMRSGHHRHSLFSGENNDDLSQHRKDTLMEELLIDDFLEVEEKCFDQFPSVNSPRKSRQNNCFFQFSFQGMKVRMDSFSDSQEHLLASCMRLKVDDFSLVETISDVHPKKMLGEWVNEVEHPRDSNDGVIMLKMVSMRPTCKVSVDGKIMSDESIAKLDLLPLRCYIDQIALRFIKGFFSSDDKNESSEDNNEDTGDGIEVMGTFFKAFNVTNTKLKVNYNPIGVDMVALKDGCYSELLNLFPLEGMELFLQPIQIQNLIGWGACLGETSSRWIEDTAATQVHKFITGASPFHSITNVGEGMADMVLIPIHQYKYRGGKNMGRAVRKGTSKFAGTVVVEALDNTSKLTKHLAFGLTELAPRTNGSSLPPVSILPSRPEKAPHNIGDTVEHAYESVSKGLRAANYTIVVVPKREYQKNGTTGAVKSVIKAIPVAILAPLSGATEAVSYSLLGIRNQLRPDLRKEEEESRRGI